MVYFGEISILLILYYKFSRWFGTHDSRFVAIVSLMKMNEFFKNQEKNVKVSIKFCIGFLTICIETKNLRWFELLSGTYNVCVERRAFE
jgi:hypothetical protein